MNGRMAIWTAAAAVAASCAVAGAACADDSTEARLAAVEKRLQDSSAPSAREIQAAVDSYLASAGSDATLVGGTAGAAGYDHGFWIRGGTFLLKTNLTIQARYETFRWNDETDEPSPGGDLSGFSLPRVTLKFSGDATCDVHYYAEFEFGHAYPPNWDSMSEMTMLDDHLSSGRQNVGNCREAWIEYESSPMLAIRMGLLKTANTRQLMTPPEMQQFVDVSLAAASVGMMMPGWTDRNRDYGIALHGAFGCDGAWSYLATVTNGDGPATRNVLDRTTNDNLAYSLRVNWDAIGHMGYEECALNQRQCTWALSVGAWAWAYSDVMSDKPHVNAGETWMAGVDAAGGYGGFTFCAAFTYGEMNNGDTGFAESNSTCWCAQIGYLFPDTAWEIAARTSWVSMDMGAPMNMTVGAHEYAFAVNYFIDGHSDKLTADVSFIQADDDMNEFQDAYTGYQMTGTGDAILLRFQWQLAL